MVTRINGPLAYYGLDESDDLTLFRFEELSWPPIEIRDIEPAFEPKAGEQVVHAPDGDSLPEKPEESETELTPGVHAVSDAQNSLAN